MVLAEALEGSHDHRSTDHREEAGHHGVGEVAQRRHDPELAKEEEEQAQEQRVHVQGHERRGLARIREA